MPDNGQSFTIPTFDDLFSTKESREEKPSGQVVNLSLSEISDFTNHPFQVNVNAELLEMAESIRQYGVLTPAIVRPKVDGGYEMIAGHRRMKASELAEQSHIPCIVRDLSDDESTILMVDSNLQREKILPSEKAFAYKMKLDAMKRQAGRPSKNNSVPLGQNYGKTSREILSENSPDSNTQIQRYIRLTELIPDLLQMVDNGDISFRPAVELSYLTPEQQTMLLEAMEVEDCTPSLSQAQRLKQLSAENHLSEDSIYTVLSEDKPNQREKIPLRDKRFEKYFPRSYTPQQKEKLLADLLEKWYLRQRQRDAR